MKLNRYKVYFRHKCLTEFAAELGISVAAARSFIKNARLPRLPLKCRNYIYSRPEWEKDRVREFVGALCAIQDKTGANLTFEQISRALSEMQQRGVA